MKPTRERKAKIGVKDVVRAWNNRASDTRHTMTDARCPGFRLITNANSQTWSVEYRPRGVDPVSGKRSPMQSITIGTPATHSPDEALAEAFGSRERPRPARPCGGPQGRDRRSGARARLHCGARVADYIAILPTKEKKGGGLISRAWAKEQEVTSAAP